MWMAASPQISHAVLETSKIILPIRKDMGLWKLEGTSRALDNLRRHPQLGEPLGCQGEEQNRDEGRREYTLVQSMEAGIYQHTG